MIGTDCTGSCKFNHHTITTAANYIMCLFHFESLIRLVKRLTCNIVIETSSTTITSVNYFQLNKNSLLHTQNVECNFCSFIGLQKHWQKYIFYKRRENAVRSALSRAHKTTKHCVRFSSILGHQIQSYIIIS